MRRVGQVEPGFLAAGVQADGRNTSALVVNSTSGSVVRHPAAKSRMNLGPHTCASVNPPLRFTTSHVMKWLHSLVLQGPPA